ncbi:uncharacterized transmembrane protein DDB_G0289901-like [Sardina pilchardus]|uniref:uncharacterized transmembrane protein DDB_G0289901-like n=1 Tax=Sardina pilchardus TaxID=27697 RepID=UPI002E150C34
MTVAVAVLARLCETSLGRISGTSHKCDGIPRCIRVHLLGSYSTSHGNSTTHTHTRENTTEQETPRNHGNRTPSSRAGPHAAQSRPTCGTEAAHSPVEQISWRQLPRTGCGVQNAGERLDGAVWGRRLWGRLGAETLGAETLGAETLGAETLGASGGGDSGGGDSGGGDSGGGDAGGGDSGGGDAGGGDAGGGDAGGGDSGGGDSGDATWNTLTCRQVHRCRQVRVPSSPHTPRGHNCPPLTTC